MLIEASAESILFRLFDHAGVEQDRYLMTTADPLPDVTRYPAWNTFERTIAASADDSEETRSTGVVAQTGVALDLGAAAVITATQLVGLRFAALPIPRGATVTRAYLEFVTRTAQNKRTSLTFAAEAQPNPSPFTDANGDLSARSVTSATVVWANIPAWPVIGWPHRSPDLAPLVQEVIALPGWNPGQPMNFLIEGAGLRSAQAFDGAPEAAPRLHVEYVTQFFLPLTAKAPAAGQTIPPAP